MFASLSPPEYLRRVDLCIAEESKRVEHYLDVQTKRPLIKLVERELIAEHVTALLEQGFDTMMREHKMEDLGRLYRLIARVDMLEEVRTRFAQYIKVHWWRPMFLNETNYTPAIVHSPPVLQWSTTRSVMPRSSKI